MNSEELLALAERVEGLAGPDREVDCQIALTAAGFFLLPPRWVGDRVGYGYFDSDGAQVRPGHGGDQLVKHYTASLDAAMTLVPEGWIWSLTNDAGEQGPYAQCWTQGNMVRTAKHRDSFGRTVVLAFCAAALRAKAMGGQS